MSTTTTGSIPDLYPGEFWKFSITITKNAATPDISGDVVTCTVKGTQGESDANAELQFNADVTTSGASGIAIFTRSAVQTADLVPGQHFVDVWWYPTDDEDRALVSDTLTVTDRVSDVP
jgi:hypothetical protein